MHRHRLPCCHHPGPCRGPHGPSRAPAARGPSSPCQPYPPHTSEFLTKIWPQTWMSLVGAVTVCVTPVATLCDRISVVNLIVPDARAKPDAIAKDPLVRATIGALVKLPLSTTTKFAFRIEAY